MFRLFSANSIFVKSGLVVGITAGIFAQQIPSQSEPTDGLSIPDVFAPSDRNQQTQTAESPLLRSAKLPSIMVNPNRDISSHLDRCQLDVEMLEDKTGIKVNLTVPDSVKIVEVTPETKTASDPTIRISITDQKAPSSAQRPLQDQSEDELDAQIQPLPDLNIEERIAHSKENPAFRSNPYFAKTQPQTMIANADPVSGKSAGAVTSLPRATGQRNFEQASSSTVSTGLPPARVPVPPAIDVRLSGPNTLEIGEIVEFQIEVTNQSQLTQRNVIVQLELPEGLEPELFDRTAWIDAGARTISWKIKSLVKNQFETIRYGLKSVSLGEQVQSVIIGVGDQTGLISEIKTHVTESFPSDNDFQPPVEASYEPVHETRTGSLPPDIQFVPVDLSQGPGGTNLEERRR